MITIHKAEATGSECFEDYCYDRVTKPSSEMTLINQLLSRDQQEIPVTAQGDTIQQDKIDISTDERKSSVQEVIPAFLKISPILNNSSDFSLSDCFSSASTHFSVSSVPTTRPASESCDILSDSMQVLLSNSEISKQDNTGKLLEDFETNLISQKQEDERGEDQQMYLKDSIFELGSRFARKCSSIDQGRQEGRRLSSQILGKSDGNQGENNIDNGSNNQDIIKGKQSDGKEEMSFSGRVVYLQTLPEQNPNGQPAKESFDPFKLIFDDSEGSSVSPSNLQLDMEFLEQIHQIDKQEDEDEAASPTLRLHRVVKSQNDSIEDRIFQWLDKEGVIQVDPSSKREEYYKQKRDNLIGMRSQQNLPSLQQIGSPSSNLSELKMGSLKLCKITSSPLFNRRKQGKDESQAQKQEKVSNTGKSYSQPIQEEDDQACNHNIHGENNNKIYEKDEDIQNKNSKKSLTLQNTSYFGRHTVLEGDSSEDPQDQILERITEIQLNDSNHSQQVFVPKLEINRNLKRLSLKLAHSPQNSPGKGKQCNTVNSSDNICSSGNVNWNPSSFILNIKNTCDQKNNSEAGII